MNRIVSTFSAISVVIPFLTSTTLAMPPDYEFVDLGYRMTARDISNTGQIVGTDSSSYGDKYACTWIDGQMAHVGPPGSGTEGVAVNDCGDIVGTWAANCGFFYDHITGEVTKYHQQKVIRHGINNSRQYLLNYSGSTAKVAYLASPGNPTVNLGYLNPDLMIGSTSSVGTRASVINNAGQIRGSSNVTKYESHGFLWENGVMTDTGSVAGGNAMNDAGQMTGGGSNAYLWSDGELIELPEETMMGCDINNHGQIVGEAKANIDGTMRYYGFLWEDGQIVNLNDFAPDGFWIQEAYAINDRGQIVGTGWTDDGSHGYVLTPVPEPATMGLVGLGLSAIVVRRRRGVRRGGRG